MSTGLHRGFYFLVLAALGALLPLLGGRFEAAGLDGRTIGLLMATLPLARLISAPLWAYLADRHQLAGAMLRASMVSSALAGIALARAEEVVPLAVAMFSFSALRAPMGALLDGLVLQGLRDAGRPLGEYGRVRLFGSIGFLMGVLAASVWTDSGLPPYLLSDALLLASAAGSFLYPWKGRAGPAPVLPALIQLAKQPFLVPLLLTAALQALTMSVYDTFYSVHIAALGLPETVVGVSIAVGVTAEVLLMGAARPLLERISPAQGLLLAALSGIPRWLLTALSADPVVLVLAQVLHGIGFGAFWICGVQRMALATPPAITASGQSLFAASSYGVGALCGAVLAGTVRQQFGAAEIFLGLGVVSTLATASALWLARTDRALSAESSTR